MTEARLDVYFDGNRVRKDGVVNLELAKGNIEFSWPIYDDRFYSVMMYDLDVPKPAPNNYESPYMHLLVTNVEGSDFGTGNHLLEYTVPKVPLGEAHHYKVQAFLQDGRIRPSAHRKRQGFNVNTFIKRHELTLVASASFVVENIKNGMTIEKKIAVAKTPRKTVAGDYFRSDTNLTEQEQKYCRCVLHVAAKQPPGECLSVRDWFSDYNGRTCTNPWAVCAKSTGTTSRACGFNYVYGNIPDDELIAYANLSQVNVPDPYNRKTMLSTIGRWKRRKMEK